jgi:head-tail adaptor
MPFGQIVQHVQPTLNTGKLRHKITLVRTLATQDAAGGQDVSSVVPFAYVWASIEALNGTEQLAAQELTSTVTHLVVIRYIGAAPSWLGSQQYLAGVKVKDSNGNIQQAQGAGTSGVLAPVWSAVLNAITGDNGISWKNIGAATPGTAVNAAMQVVYQGRKFQIVSVLNPDERNKILLLMCIEINDSLQQNITMGSAIG